ncbi:MAG: ZIP family metal transporter [Bacteriovoracaceae bacterium]|nr:ZIP family metal transporter [Bacteriovoracaceae bacterium]
MEVLSSMNGLLLAFLGSLVAGFATGLGAVPIYFVKSISQKLQDQMMGFGAGVMLAASCFSLLNPAIEIGETLYASKLVSIIVIALGVACGAIALRVCDLFFPHEHFIKGSEGSDQFQVKRIWLFIIAITLHNFPEGLAVGVSVGGQNINEAVALIIGISLQNMPEGLVVALSLITLKYSRAYSLWIALLTGLVEPIGSVLGYAMINLSEPLLPFGLAFAAGAMIFVISHEIIPESHRHGHEYKATMGLMLGFIVMMVLDVYLG